MGDYCGAAWQIRTREGGLANNISEREARIAGEPVGRKLKAGYIDFGNAYKRIKHGRTNEEVKIGFGQQLGYLTEFNWVDFRGFIEDSVTYEVIIKNAEIIGDTTAKLENPSIVVRKKEVGGGIITFRNGKYEWVHQSD